MEFNTNKPATPMHVPELRKMIFRELVLDKQWHLYQAVLVRKHTPLTCYHCLNKSPQHKLSYCPRVKFNSELDAFMHINEQWHDEIVENIFREMLLVFDHHFERLVLEVPESLRRYMKRILIHYALPLKQAQVAGICRVIEQHVPNLNKIDLAICIEPFLSTRVAHTRKFLDRAWLPPSSAPHQNWKTGAWSPAFLTCYSERLVVPSVGVRHRPLGNPELRCEGQWRIRCPERSLRYSSIWNDEISRAMHKLVEANMSDTEVKCYYMWIQLHGTQRGYHGKVSGPEKHHDSAQLMVMQEVISLHDQVWDQQLHGPDRITPHIYANALEGYWRARGAQEHSWIWVEDNRFHGGQRAAVRRYWTGVDLVAVGAGRQWDIQHRLKKRPTGLRVVIPPRSLGGSIEEV